MIYVKRVCTVEGCELTAIKNRMCGPHARYNRCKNCIDWPVSRGKNKGYDGHCATCFKQLFPGDPRSKHIPKHLKELRVRAEIEKHFEGFVHDRPMFTSECDCSIRRRIDHRKVIKNVLFGVETDEHCHLNYSKEDEANRYHDIMMAHGGPMIFVRFNPDLKGVSFEKKLEVLVAEIKSIIALIESGDRDVGGGFLTEIKLFYEADRHRIVTVADHRSLFC